MVVSGASCGVRRTVLAHVAAILQVPAADLDEHASFSALGVDSLSASRLARALGDELGAPVPVIALYEHATIAQLAEHLGRPTNGAGAPASLPAQAGERDEPIAIVGMSCRLPMADGLDAFWRVLAGGVDCVRDIPDERWDVAALYDPTGRTPKSTITRSAALLDRVDLFEPEFFGLSPREAIHVDPQQRVMLELAWEALECAGLPPDGLRGRPVGVFVGGMAVDYGELMWNANAVNASYGPGAALTLLSNRISYLFRFSGPSLTVDTACASSLTALHLACHSLRRREAELALAGGIILHLRPHGFVTMSRLGALAPDGRSKAFSAAANGYGRGEGGGLVVLKRLADARRDGDVIHAIVRGSAINHNSTSNGITAPNPRAQAAVLRDAWARAGASPADAAYVEAHGTGTALGDPLEAEALGQVFGAGRAPGDPLIIGSSKPNIGHTETAAGVAGLIKVVLAMRHRTIPPSIHAEPPNPLIPFDDWRLRVPAAAVPWPSGRRLAGVSAFGFGGANAHVVVESTAVEPVHVLAVSAPDAAALDARIDEILTRGAASGDAGDGCERLAVVAADARSAASALAAHRSGAGGAVVARGRVASRGGLAFVFAGIGSVWAGMGSEPIARSRAFQSVIERCDPVTRRAIGVSVAHELAAARDDRLVDPAIHGLLAVVVGMALDAVWRDAGVTPDVVVGHSIGEFAAAAAAGVVTVEEATRLVCAFLRFSRVLSDAGTAMASVGLGIDAARAAIAGFDDIGVCVDLAPDQVVIGGDARALAEICAQLAARSVEVRPLRTAIAPHSPVARRFAHGLPAALGELAARPPAIPWISTVTAAPIETAIDAAYWARNLGGTNRFREAIDATRARGCDTFVMVAAHPVMASATRATLAARAPARVYATMARGEHERTFHATVAALWVEGRAARPPRAIAGTVPSAARARIIPLSAATPASLGALVADWRDRLSRWDPAALDAACAAAGARRTHHRHRLAAVGRGARALSDGLGAATAGAAPASPAPVVFVFSGQGAAFEGVARSLYAEDDVFRTTIDACDRVVRDVAGWSLVDALLFDDPAARARRTGVVQPLLFAIQLGLARLWQSWGIAPAAVIGQSVGEVAAACTAGALSLAEATRIVVLRGRAMEDAGDGGRSAEIALPAAEVVQRLAGRAGVCVAGAAGPATTLIAGDADRVEAVVHELAAAGAACRLLRMDYAFHSHHMDGVVLRLAATLGAVSSTEPAIALWSTVTAAPVRSGELDARYWCANVRQPFLLAPVVDQILAAGPATLLEISPHPVLTAPLRDCLRARGGGVALHSLRRDRDDRGQLLEALSALYLLGHTVAWDAVQGRGDPTSLPTYPWDRRRFWVAADRTAVAPAAGAGLLGRRLDSGVHTGTVYWESVISSDAPSWVADHRVMGRTVMPGAAFAEIAITAGTAVLGDGLAVRALQFVQALSLGDDPRLLQVCLVREGDGAVVRVLSRPAAQAGAAMVLHATARVVPDASRAEDDAPVDLEPDRFVRDVDPQALYLRLESRQLAYGPLFRGLVSAREGADEAIGTVVLPGGLASQSAGLHPALLDACFHVAAVALPDDGALWIPVGIERLRVLAPGARSLRVHAQVRSDDARRVRDARLRAWTDDGALALEVDGLRVARVDAGRRPLPVEDWLHEEQWLPAPLALGAPTGVEGAWIVIGDDEAEPIAGALERAGARVVRFAGGAGADAVPAGEFRGVVGAPPASPASGLAAGTAAVIAGAVAAARVAAAADAPLVLITRGARGLDARAATSLASAAAWGVGRALAMEDPVHYGGIIDLDPEAAVSEQLAVVIAELGAGMPDDQVAYRDGRRRVGRLVRSRDLLGAPVACRPDATYLVTGGLGALGLIAAGWLGQRGARRVVLVGRSGMPPRSTWSALDPSSMTGQRAAAIQALEARGVVVWVEALDASDQAAIAALVARLADVLPPIRGVVHAAGVLRDQAMMRIDHDSVAAVVGAKVGAALALHHALGSSLDFFVLYSSAAGTIGSAGQMAYAAANVVLDEIARSRRAAGLAATSVAWGPWAETGMAADPRLLERLAASGMDAIATSSGVGLLDRLAVVRAPHVGVFPVRWPVFLASRRLPARSWLSALGDEPTPEPTGDARPQAPAIDLSDPERREQVIAEWLDTCLGRLLGVPADRMRREVSLQELGLDSLVAVELRNAIEDTLGVKVPLASLSDGTIESLAAQIASLVAPPASASDAAGLTRAAWSPLVKISEGQGCPLVCVHPVGGNILCYRPLAAALGPAWPLWALQAPTGGEAPPDRSIAAMADRYLAAARAAGTGEPWLLCGFSFGGAVAYEMAQRAISAGERVAHVILIDTRVPRRVLPDEDTLLAWCLRDLTGGRTAVLGDGPTATARILDGARRAGLFGAEITEAAVTPIIDVFRASIQAMIAWLPAEGQFPVTLLRSEDTPLESIEPWRRLCRGALRELAVAGDHYALLRPPHLSAVAAHLQDCLAAAPQATRVA